MDEDKRVDEFASGLGGKNHFAADRAVAKQVLGRRRLVRRKVRHVPSFAC